MTLPIVERLRRDFDGQPFDTAICRDVRTALDTIEELVEALTSIERVVLEQRCERGTPWDLACVTIAGKVHEYVAPILTKIGGAQ
jgi:hypothetical protein